MILQKTKNLLHYMYINQKEEEYFTQVGQVNYVLCVFGVLFMQLLSRFCDVLLMGVGVFCVCMAGRVGVCKCLQFVCYVCGVCVVFCACYVHVLFECVYVSVCFLVYVFIFVFIFIFVFVNMFFYTYLYWLMLMLLYNVSVLCHSNGDAYNLLDFKQSIFLRKSLH